MRFMGYWLVVPSLCTLGLLLGACCKQSEPPGVSTVETEQRRALGELASATASASAREGELRRQLAAAKDEAERAKLERELARQKAAPRGGGGPAGSSRPKSLLPACAPGDPLCVSDDPQVPDPKINKPLE